MPARLKGHQAAYLLCGLVLEEDYATAQVCTKLGLSLPDAVSYGPELLRNPLIPARQ